MILIYKLESCDLVFYCPRERWDDFLEAMPGDDEVEEYMNAPTTTWQNPDWGRKWKVITTLFSRLQNANGINFIIYERKC